MTEQPIEAYPLQWPPGRPRMKWPERSNFEVTLGKSIKDVQEEVRRLGGMGLVISSNLPPPNGMPNANSSQPADRGVAVYFRYKKKPMCFACDRWQKIENNMRAIAKTIDAFRGIERCGSVKWSARIHGVHRPTRPGNHGNPGARTGRPPRHHSQAHRRLAAQPHPHRGCDTHQWPATTRPVTTLSELRIMTGEHSKVESVSTEQRAVDPDVGMRCMATWLRSNGFRIQADDAEFYAKQVTKLEDDIASIRLHRDTAPLTRSRLRHAMAGVDWRQAK